MNLEEIIKQSDGAVFNNAAQIWNHDFFWKCLIPPSKRSKNLPTKIIELINKNFGNIDTFKEEFNKSALGNFGSGWTWLVQKGDELKITNTDDADNPLTKNGQSAIIGIDVWEHSYYIDYRNKRNEYLNAFWNIVNWEFAESNLK